MIMNTLFRCVKPVVKKRVLHLDLKGLPPTPKRLLELLRIAKLARYNAVLVEWEDTFPWDVDRRFRGETCYSVKTVSAFCKTAKELDIEIIPLVQTIGHMETFLQIPDYARLREIPNATDCLNPLARGARQLVLSMVKDVLRILPKPGYFHLGGDEARSFGKHPETKAFIEKHGKAALYLRHMDPLLDHLNRNGIRPVLWHDMMCDWPEDALRRLGKKCDLMVWGYNGTFDNVDATRRYSRAVITRFAKAKVPMWGAGAFKCGQKAGENLPDPADREENIAGWVKAAREFNMVGVCATGWSRDCTANVQYMPIDASLDVLIAAGVILHDGKSCPGGLKQCLSVLDAGEAERFRRRREALAAFDSACKTCWYGIRNLRQYLTGLKVDPTRRPNGGFGVLLASCLANELRVLQTQGTALSGHFQGLVDLVWINRMILSRTQSVADESLVLTKMIEACNRLSPRWLRGCKKR